MKIGERVLVQGYVDEIRKDTIIIRNSGGYFGTSPNEIDTYKTDHGYMWVCPDCGLVVHSDFKKCVRCGHKREDERSRSE